MLPLIAGAAVLGASLVGAYAMATAREHRHQAIRQLPFPSAWEKILVANVKHYNWLPPHLQKELQGHIRGSGLPAAVEPANQPVQET
jgi:hypothetical protein